MALKPRGRAGCRTLSLYAQGEKACSFSDRERVTRQSNGA
jgi:hypothetical protein